MIDVKGCSVSALLHVLFPFWINEYYYYKKISLVVHSVKNVGQNCCSQRNRFWFCIIPQDGCRTWVLVPRIRIILPLWVPSVQLLPQVLLLQLQQQPPYVQLLWWLPGRPLFNFPSPYRTVYANVISVWFLTYFLLALLLFYRNKKVNNKGK